MRGVCSCGVPRCPTCSGPACYACTITSSAACCDEQRDLNYPGGDPYSLGYVMKRAKTRRGVIERLRRRLPEEGAE
jgi:hypothetical protein